MPTRRLVGFVASCAAEAATAEAEAIPGTVPGWKCRCADARRGDGDCVRENAGVGNTKEKALVAEVNPVLAMAAAAAPVEGLGIRPSSERTC